MPKSTIHLDSIYHHVSHCLTQIFPFLSSKHVPSAYSIPGFQKLLTRFPDLTPYELYIPVQFKTITKIGGLWTRDLYSTYKAGMRITLRTVASWWRSLATGTGPSKQLFSVILGYTTISAFTGGFLASSVLYSGTSAIIQNPMTQQLIVVKVAVFILIKLVVFPFRCSVILDISTLSLFRDVSQLATGCVTCHACHGCVTDFRPILGNPVEVTHVTSPGHVYIFPH